MSCNIFHTSLDAHPQYEALSYAWGNPDFSRTIYANSFLLPVSTHLHEALLRLRRPSEKRTMWIDAICINQGDPSERSQQVGMMRSIFRSASNVVVWLGEESRTSNRAVAFFKEIGEHGISRGGEKFGINRAEGEEHQIWERPVLYYDFSQSPLWKYIDESRNEDWAAVDSLLARPWWSRTWTVQEVWSARSLTLQCGDVRIPWKLFQAAMDYQEAWDEMGDIVKINMLTRAIWWKNLNRRYSLAIHISKQRVNGSTLSDLLWNT